MSFHLERAPYRSLTDPAMPTELAEGALTDLINLLQAYKTGVFAKGVFIFDWQRPLLSERLPDLPIAQSALAEIQTRAAIDQSCQAETNRVETQRRQEAILFGAPGSYWMDEVKKIGDDAFCEMTEWREARVKVLANLPLTDDDYRWIALSRAHIELHR